MPITVGQDTAKTRKTLTVGNQSVAYYSIPAAESAGLGDFSRLPAALKVVLENMLRFEDGKTVSVDDIKAFSTWADQGGKNPREIAYRPARVLMQDFTGVPAVVDLAAMRDGLVALGGDAPTINPLNPVDLVIDHSVMIDEFGNPRAFQMPVRKFWIMLFTVTQVLATLGSKTYAFAAMLIDSSSMIIVRRTLM